MIGDYVVYCFAPVDGYSSFGSYTGNGSADGPFVYTGFRPAWVLLKAALVQETGLFTITGDLWLQQTKISCSQVSDAENPTSYMDFTSNGFKLRIVSRCQQWSNLRLRRLRRAPLRHIPRPLTPQVNTGNVASLG
jgi:hypothetical protein